MKNRLFGRAALLLCCIVCLVILFSVGAASAQSGILFDAQGGIYPNGISDYQAEGASGAEFLMPAVPTKAGFVFGGWYSALDGKGERLNAPILPSETVKVYAWWVPEKMADDFAVRLIFIGSPLETTPQPVSYTYTFIEKNTGARYPLLIDEKMDLDPRPEAAVYIESIKLPKNTPTGAPAEYVQDEMADAPFIERAGSRYFISYQQADRRGSESGQSTYFNRSILFRRMIDPRVQIIFTDAPAQEVRLNLTLTPGIPTRQPVTRSQTVAADRSDADLFSVFSNDLPALNYLLIDEVNASLELQGQNRYTLSADPIEGFELSALGGQTLGWTFVFTKK